MVSAPHSRLVVQSTRNNWQSLTPFHEYEDYSMERARSDQQNRWKLRRDLEDNLLGSVADIIMLQEHHLDSTQSKEVRDLLPGSWQTIWEPAIGEDGNHGGICTLIQEHLAQGLTPILGRANFCMLAIQGQRWNFMNV